jgi:small ligand-binding sensory domain FIST
VGRFRIGHAAHPDWRAAADLALAQVHGQASDPDVAPHANLGILYASSAYGPELDRLVETLRERSGVDDWVGAIGHGVCAGSTEYPEEPALALMLASLPGDGFRIFSGRHRAPEGDERTADGALRSHTALVHADPTTPQLQEVVADLAARTATGYLFGGLVSGDAGGYSQVAGEALNGGLSGVILSSAVPLRSRVTQGCAPLAGEHVISECSSHFICALDGRPALDVLLADLEVPERARASRDGDEILRSLPADRLREGLFVGLSPGHADRGVGFGDYLVRNVVGIDPQNRLLAVAATPAEGDRVVFCTRDQAAARRDLIRICTELRGELEDESLQVRGALYHSCVARGANLFGAPGAELELIRHNLGEIPLIGFHASGEIARDRVYGYTGVLTLFV